MQLLMTPEGKKIQVNPSDLCLYTAPRNPPNTGTMYTQGTDLYMHKARSGKQYFYTYHWSMWQGSEDVYALVSEDEAKQFVLHRATEHGYIANGVEVEDCEALWPRLFEEDA